MSSRALSYSAALTPVHPSWHPLMQEAWSQLNPDYLNQLATNNDWLPGTSKLLNAFSLPMPSVKVVLFGESPYPRAASANGYAFWDQAITALWSESGLDKRVNRATSLRNILKMLLIADHRLTPKDTSQAAIAALDKSDLVQTGAEFFQNCLKHGFLLLNASLVLQDRPPQKDAREFSPFLSTIMAGLLKNRPDITLLLLGRIANDLSPLLPNTHHNRLAAMHPYNLDFIQHPEIIEFFRPLRLLVKPD
ncbi:MAG TPA: uracil-DNA glycosylase family protein [Gammaproteobacteria bacterium]|jgi:uracil-DNA glycosylase|nr:uracil-DNA glycosylase family protein [Gammaproteobacteria bacterium]